MDQVRESIALIRFKTGQKVHSEEQLLWVRSSGESATLLLIKEIFDHHQDLSFFILRNKILTTEAENPYLKGLVKVVSKRISFREDFSGLAEICLQNPDAEIKSAFVVRSNFNIEPDWKPPVEFVNHENAFLILKEMQNLLPRSEILHKNPFPVTCLIVDENLKIISWGFNSSAVNKIYHAEFNAIQRLCRKIPKNAKIFVTHKPCQMCTGFIYQNSATPESLEIFFAVSPPGCRSQNTILDQQSVWIHKPEFELL